MTLNALLDRLDLTRPNAWTRAQKTAWVSDLEASLWAHILLQPPGLWRPYDPDADGKTRLLLPDGWARLYTSYLDAMIDLANGEYDRYQNSMAIYNGYFAELGAWYAADYAPAHTAAAWTEPFAAAYDDLRDGVRMAVSDGGAALLAIAWSAPEAFTGQGTVTVRLTDGTVLAEVDIINEPEGHALALALPYGSGEIVAEAQNSDFTAGMLQLCALVQPAARQESRFT